MAAIIYPNSRQIEAARIPANEFAALQQKDFKVPAAHQFPGRARTRGACSQHSDRNRLLAQNNPTIKITGTSKDTWATLAESLRSTGTSRWAW